MSIRFPVPAAGRRATLAVALLAFVLLGACGGDGGGDTLVGLAREQPLQVGEAVLPDVTAPGAPVPFAFLAEPGGLLVVYFGYTACPDLCPTTMSDLREALGRVGDGAARVRVAMATVDPERDDRTVLTGYLGSFFDPGRFVALRTTDAAALKAAEDAFLATSSVTKAADGSVEVAHSATTYVVDDNGQVLVEWPFGVGPKDMAHDFRILLQHTERTT